MRLIFRFAAVYLALAMIMFVAIALSTARREQERIEQEAVTDVRDLGYTLATVLSATFESGGLAATRSAVDGAARNHREVSVVLRTDAVTTEPLEEVHGVRRGPQGVVVKVPILVKQSTIGVLELSRALPNEKTLFATALKAELPSAAALSLAVSVVAIFLGAIMIGNPLRRMVLHARKVGAGDYTARLRSDRRDEIGDLKRELNTMCEKLEQSRQDLAQESAARLTTLQELRHLDRLRTIGTIASSLAHELGTPLNVLLIRGQTLASGKASTQDVVRSGEVMVQQVNRMSTIVRRILDYARKDPSPKSRQALTDITRRSVHLLEGVAAKARVEILGPEVSDAHVTVNVELFEQAVTNVLMNAIHAMPNGGRIHVRVRREPHAQADGSLHSFRACVVEIEDSGAGIAQDDVAKLFEPFYTTRERGKGTGLGLPVAKGILEEHGGFVAIRSKLGVGTTVQLCLPEAP